MPRIIAVDWSGAQQEGAQKNKIWRAGTCNGELVVVEIYPRVFVGPANTSSPVDRLGSLEENFPALDDYFKELMVASQDAFDAGGSALVMAGDDDYWPDVDLDNSDVLEGQIWTPPE